MNRPCLITFFSLFLLTQIVFSQEKPAFTDLDVFELEWVQQPKISPDGQKIVYVRRGMDIMKDRRQSRLWMINADGSDHQKLSHLDVNESNPTWSPDGKRIVFTASTDQGSELFMYWVATGKVARISQLPASPRGLIWSPYGQQIAFSMFVASSELSLVRPPKRPNGAKWADQPRITTRLKHEADGAGYMRPGFSHLFVIPAEGGTPKQVTTGNFQHRSAPVWSHDGQCLYFSSNRGDDWEYDFRNSEIYRVALSDGTITTLTNRKGPDRSLTLSPDGQQIAYLGFDDRMQTYQNTLLYVMDEEGNNKRQIKVALDQSISSPVWDSEGKGLYFMFDEYGNTKLAHTDLDGKVTRIADNLGGTGIGRPYGGGSISVSKNGVFAFNETTPDYPAELAIVKKIGQPATKVMSLNDDILGERTLGKVEEIWYNSTVDNRRVQGWIVKPPFFDATKKYPLLVENHGGPVSNYGDRFSPEIQLYATAGYVVFYPNPRGSTSYGEEFANLLYHNYPGEDYNDVMDGVDAVIQKGYVAPDSLYVTGGSAGGIMTAWMIGKNNRFRAAAVVKPVMNWISKTLVADNYYGYANTRYPGQPWENPMEYWKFSPLSLVGNIETPTLVMVGTSDLRTPLSEAKQLYHALKLRKVETALVEVPGAYHFIANRPSQLITKVAHVLAWFERY
ncbi:MAG: S9 family peptidase [Bacteroidota bacterium]